MSRKQDKDSNVRYAFELYTEDNEIDRKAYEAIQLYLARGYKIKQVICKGLLLLHEANI